MKINKTVSVSWQMLFAVLPFVGYWATYRIKKLRKFLIISIALGFGLNILVSVFVPNPFNILIELIISIPILVYFVRKWSIEWNNKITS